MDTVEKKVRTRAFPILITAAILLVVYTIIHFLLIVPNENDHVAEPVPEEATE